MTNVYAYGWKHSLNFCLKQNFENNSIIKRNKNCELITLKFFYWALN